MDALLLALYGVNQSVKEDGTTVYSFTDQSGAKVTYECPPDPKTQLVKDLKKVYQTVGPDEFTQLFLLAVDQCGGVKNVEVTAFLKGKKEVRAELEADLVRMREALAKKFIQKWGPKVDFNTFVSVLNSSYNLSPLDVARKIVKSAPPPSPSPASPSPPSPPKSPVPDCTSASGCSNTTDCCTAPSKLSADSDEPLVTSVGEDGYARTFRNVCPGCGYPTMCCSCN